ncbi:MAG: DUF1844 domain-containing protein [Desulfobacteraceae bacterium]|nr:MAG: DUF1844 domain-containing protein [Desulfobacteraceae bacterium]
MAKGDGFIMEDGKNESGQGPEMPKIDFSSFVLSLYSSVLVQLGKIEDPATGEKEKNLELAKHSIDIIAMLEEKTAGNLDSEEANLIKTLLSEIRMAYVEAS